LKCRATGGKETIMDQFSELRRLGQIDSSEAGEIFRAFLRGQVRQSLVRIMAEEVGELCGPKYRPTADAESHRAGSAKGVLLHEGRREEVIRPRVRRRKADGSTEEVRLATYASAQEPGQLDDMLLRAIIAGASGREMKQVHPDSPRTSKSSVSRLWAKEGVKLVTQLRKRDITSQEWLVLMLDGIRLSKDQLAVVALGIAIDGKKHILDFELGSSENFEVCRDLVSRLITRGFRAPHGLLAVLDGADALRTAVLTFFADAVIQRCLVHKERNIRGRLSKRHWGELARLFKRLREVEGEVAGGEAHSQIERFLMDKNAAALDSLREAGEELIALHRLNVPSTLHVSLLSTNLIENSFRNTRRKLGRVTRFRAETDQASRWLAAALMEAEKGFRRLIGYKDLPRLAEALRRRQAGRAASCEALLERRQRASTTAPPGGASPPLRAAPSAPSTPHPAKT
jgi:putative transposase